MSDLISKQAVFDAIEDDNRNGHYSCFASDKDAQRFKQIINELLPVEITEDQVSEWCKEHDYKIISTKLLEDFLKRH